MKADEKKCPRCAEHIKKDALVCRHCGHEFDARQIALEKERAASTQKNGLIGCAAIVVLLLAVGMCSSSNKDEPTSDSSNTQSVITAEEAKVLEERNKDAIAKRLAEAKNIPASDSQQNLDAYNDLVKLAPTNTSFIEKRDKYQLDVTESASFNDSPEKALDITKMDWEKGGFGSVQIISLTVKNKAPFPIKDFSVECTHQGPSGTDMDSNTRVVYDQIPAKGSKRIRQINMGFIHSQVATSRCEITSAKRG